MANDGFVQVPPNSTGGKVDCSSLSVGGAIVARQRVVIGDPSKSAGLALVSAGSLQVVNTAGTAHIGQVSVTGSVAISNTVTVQGQVSVTGSVAISNNLNISAMPAVALTTLNGLGKIDGISANVNVVLQAGTNNIGFINGISATVNVAGTLTIGGTVGGTSSTAASSFTLIGGNDGSIGRVALMDAAGHQIISGTVALTTLNGLGKIDGISANVNVVLQAGANNIGTVNNISAAVVLGAGAANIGTVNNISAAVGLAAGTQHIGEVNISTMPAVVLAAGTNNVGTINNISATVVVSGSLSIGGFAGNSSVTAASSFTLIGGTDGSLGRVALMDAAGHQIISGTVALAAGAANIGSINNISANVNVVLQAGANNIGTVNGISATVTVIASGVFDSSAGSTTLVRVGDSANSAVRCNVVAGNLSISGTLDAISASVTVQGNVGLNAGTNNIGFINGISATVNVAGSLTIGGIVNSASITAGTTLTLVGGSDGFISHILGTDTQGRLIMSGVLNSASVTVGSQVYLMGGCDGSLARTIATDTGGKIRINDISATVNVAGTFTVGGGQVGNASATVGSVLTLIGGMDGSLARVALTDAAGHFVVTGTVALTTLNGLGKIDGISANVNVVLQAGANNIGTINNISAAIVLAAGAANIGFINNISATVIVAGEIANGSSLSTTNKPVLIGGNDSAGGAGGVARTLLLDTSGRLILGAGAQNIGSINNISAAVVLAAGGNNIGTINNISAVVGVNIAAISSGVTLPVNIVAASAGVVLGVSLGTQVVLAAGTANIGAVSLGAQVAAGTSVTAASVVVLAGGTSRVSAGITGSAAVAWLDPNGRGVVVLNHPSIVASATQGPQNKDITATAFATLVASAGASFVYVTGILVTNGSASVTGVAFASSDQTAAPQVVAYLAANGGGFNKEFNPPWKLSTGTALQGRIFPTAALTVTSVISFYVGP